MGKIGKEDARTCGLRMSTKKVVVLKKKSRKSLVLLIYTRNQETPSWRSTRLIYVDHSIEDDHNSIVDKRLGYATIPHCSG